MDKIEKEKFRLSTITAATTSAERTVAARMIAKGCTREQLADLLDQTMAERLHLEQQIKDCDAKLDVLNGAWAKA